MKTILLKFAGPLQSWGTSSSFETRHTDFYPSKSGIIGIISASFGLDRDEDEKIRKLNDLNFATRIDQQGRLLRDYHTAHKYKDNGDLDRTYVTNRYYIEDAIYVVAISHEDDSFIDSIEEALKNPYYQTYMGRRSLPLNADFFIKSVDLPLIESLEELPWQAKDWYKRSHTNNLEVYIDADLVESSNIRSRKDKVISFSQAERKFAYRDEARINIDAKDPDNSEKEEHDIFKAIGDKDVFI